MTAPSPPLRKLCVVTGSRADYGLLFPVLRCLAGHPAVQLRLVACGTHPSPEFGSTIREIEADGFVPDETIEAVLSSDTPTGVCKAMGLTMIAAGDAFRRLAPDIVVVLGDRFEILAVAAAAAVCTIPLAHIAGGQITEGAVDDAMRHAITKLAQLHFTAAEEYSRRIVQLGESPDRVHTVGSLGLDNVRSTPLTARAALERDIGFRFGACSVLVTHHPETLDPAGGVSGIEAILEALAGRPDLRALFTLPNADAGGRVIRSRIEAFVAAHPDRCAAVPSLGRQRYLSALACVDAVVGNSSSGLIEAPSFRIPTVNVGDRQRGRIRAASVIDCAPMAGAVGGALDRALSPSFRAGLAGLVNPFGDGHAAERIVDVLTSVPLDTLVRKVFHDCAFPAPPTLAPPWTCR